ncbi:MAG: twin-arginine translocase TatA/TatE family subunit [Nitrospiria bacterium]
MFGIGIPELIVVLLIAFVVVGPEKLPKIARTLGKGLFELRRASEEVRNEIEKEGEAIEKEFDEESKHLNEGKKGGAAAGEKVGRA